MNIKHAQSGTKDDESQWRQFNKKWSSQNGWQLTRKFSIVDEPTARIDVAQRKKFTPF